METNTALTGRMNRGTAAEATTALPITTFGELMWLSKVGAPPFPVSVTAMLRTRPVRTWASAKVRSPFECHRIRSSQSWSIDVGGRERVIVECGI